MSYQMGKLVEMDELVECDEKGFQIAIFELICQFQSINCNRAFIHSPI